MIEARTFLSRARLQPETLEAWMETAWLRPRRGDSGWTFSDIDIARARLIRDLQEDLGINDHGVTVVLDLLDQLHGLRRTLRILITALEAQPTAVRHKLAEDIRERSETARPANGPERAHHDGNGKGSPP